MSVVDEHDQVTPPSYEGMTAEEMRVASEEFQARVLENARRIATQNVAPPPSPAPAPAPKPGEQVTREEFNRTLAVALPGMIAVAKMTAAAGKSDWNTLLPKVEAVMKDMTAEQQANHEVWTEVYYNVKGRMTDVLVDDARKKALGLEPPSPPPPAPETPHQFTADELTIIEGMGVTPAMYLDADKKLATNFQPFTTDNRRVAR